MRTIEEFAGSLYTAYCHAVGGKAFNGDPLPDWKEFRADQNKQIQSDAWIYVATIAEREADYVLPWLPAKTRDDFPPPPNG